MGTSWSILPAVGPRSSGDNLSSGSVNPIKTSAKCCPSVATHQARSHPKRRSPLVTIKKLIRLHRRKVPSNQSYVRAFVEVAAKWTAQELSQLVATFESTLALRDLYLAALAAHPPVSCVTEDLRGVLTARSLPDMRVWYKGIAYPAHKAILYARSAYFQLELSKSPAQSSVTLDELAWHSQFRCDADFVNGLLVLIYTGQSSEAPAGSCKQAWTMLKEYYGIASTLMDDVAKMRDVSPFHDATLMFAKAGGTAAGAGVLEEESLGNYPCHQVILAARSSFFRNLLLRKSQAAADKREAGGCSNQEATARVVIALDDAVISHRFGRLLLKVLYEGSVDLSCIMARKAAASSLSEARAIVSGGCSSCGDAIDESMELYHVGKFLDLSSLTHGAETIIVDNLTVDNVASILAWAREPSGSDWVRRQCLHFIEEQFMRFVHSPGFVNLDSESLRTVLLSDFVQAPEMEVLSAVVHWSEYQLVKQREMREPNLLANTAHSITRRAFRRRDVSGAELNSIVGEFLPLLRIDHLVPADSEMLNNIVRRGIALCLPPSHVAHLPGAVVCPHCCAGSRDSARSWMPDSLHQGSQCRSHCGSGRGNGSSGAAPRAYLPFYQEAKRLLEEQTGAVSGGDALHLRRPRHISLARAGGDTLKVREAVNRCSHPASHGLGFLHGELTVLDGSAGIITRVWSRVADLLQGHLVRDVLARHTNLTAVCTLVCLWGLREADLPDHLVCMLQPQVERLVLHYDEALQTADHRCSRHRLNKEEYFNGNTCSSSDSSGASSRDHGAGMLLTAAVPDVASSLSSLECGSALRLDVPGVTHQRFCSTWGASATACCCPDVTVSNLTNVKCDTLLPEHRASACYVSASGAGDLRNSFPDVTLHSHSGSLNDG